MSNTTFTEAAKAMFTEPIVASFTTVNADGSLQVTPTWIDIDGDVVVVNTMSARRKALNVGSRPGVGVMLVDPANPFRVASLAGEVVGIVEEGAGEHIDALTQRYMGLDKHPFDHPDEGVRVMIRIEPRHIYIQPS
jgi:PPOX class probable F420-dependent enzyme